MSILEWILLFVALFLLIMAFYCEARDYRRVKEIESTDENPNSVQFLSCFGYETRVYWRTTYIPSFFLAIILTYIISKIYCTCPSFWLFFIILVVTFVMFYGVASLTSFHVYRILCSKARPDMNIM